MRADSGSFDLSRPITRIRIAKEFGVPVNRAGDGERVITFEQLKSWVRTREFVRHLFRYQESVLLVPEVALVSRPLVSLLLLRLLSRGHAFIQDRHGTKRRVTVVAILSAALAAILQWPQVGQELRATRQAAARLRTAKGGNNGVVLDRSSPPLYLRTDLIFGQICGGATAHTAGVLNSMHQIGASPIVVTTDEVATVRPDIERHLVRPESRYWDFAEIPTICFNRTMRTALHERLNERSLGFVYQRYCLNNFSGLEYARARRIPFVLEYNGSELWVTRQWGGFRLRHEALTREIEDLNIRNADLVVTVSQPLADELKQRGVAPERILTQPNGVDHDVYAPDPQRAQAMRRRLGLENKRVIGFSGTFGPWHGAEVLAHAYVELLKRQPACRQDTRLMLIGDGLRHAAVRAILEEAHISPNCLLVGLVPQHEAVNYLDACDVLVAPHVPNTDGSEFFGSPTKLFEYMSMAKAVVATAVGQLGKVIQHGTTGVVIPPNDAGAMAQAMAELVDNPQLCTELGAQARATVIAQHTWQAHTRRILEKLDSLCTAG